MCSDSRVSLSKPAFRITYMSVFPQTSFIFSKSFNKLTSFKVHTPTQKRFSPPSQLKDPPIFNMAEAEPAQSERIPVSGITLHALLPVREAIPFPE